MDFVNKYDTTNPLVNKEDIKDHYGVGAVVHKDDQIVLLYHKKYSFSTIPIGKVPVDGNTADGIKQELLEELGIEVKELNLLGSFNKTYYRGGSVYTNIHSFLFDIIDFSGTIENKEPLKHPYMDFITFSKLSTWPANELSDMTRFYIMLKTQILDSPSVRLIND